MLSVFLPKLGLYPLTVINNLQSSCGPLAFTSWTGWLMNALVGDDLPKVKRLRGSLALLPFHTLWIPGVWPPFFLLLFEGTFYCPRHSWAPFPQKPSGGWGQLGQLWVEDDAFWDFLEAPVPPAHVLQLAYLNLRAFKADPPHPVSTETSENRTVCMQPLKECRFCQVRD